MTAKIVVVGSFNTDLTAYMQRMPTPGETVSGHTFVTGPGGKGSNQAVAAARLGAEVTFIGRVGQDVFANIAFDLWKAENIRTDYVVRDPKLPTGVAPILVEDTGENMIVVVLGANLAISLADIDAAEDVIAQADVLITQLEINFDAVHHALEVAKRHNVTTILNPAPAAVLSAETLSLADYITPNESEMNVLGAQGSSVDEKARSLMVRDDQTVIVTLGSQGARFIQKDNIGQIGVFPVQVVDTTGAGDAFNAGFAVALAEGLDLHDALAFANATAGLCVTRPGTARSMPHRDEVDALLKQHK